MWCKQGVFTKIQYFKESSFIHRPQSLAAILTLELTSVLFQAILEGSQADCEEVLKNTSDIETMAHLVTGQSIL